MRIFHISPKTKTLMTQGMSKIIAENLSPSRLFLRKETRLSTKSVATIAQKTISEILLNLVLIGNKNPNSKRII